MSEYVSVLKVEELAPGQATERMVGGRAIAVYNVGGRFYATSNFCVHRGGPLGQGALDGCVIMCPWHAWTFDVTTGANTVNEEMKVPSYPVRVQDGQVFVQID
jgi:nitrite reductase/ring-hydroxylating ferredoxin subunit